MLLLAAQRLEQEAVAAVALLAAFVRAAAAGRAVPGGAARLVGPPARHGVTGHAASAQHADGAVSGRGGRLTLDVEVLVSGGEVQVGVLAEVPVAVEEKAHVSVRIEDSNPPADAADRLTPCVRAQSAEGSGAAAASSSPIPDQNLQTRTRSSGRC